MDEVDEHCEFELVTVLRSLTMPLKHHKPPKAEDFDVRRIFEETDPLIVPRWQRDYSWDPDEQVKKLLEDLLSFSERLKDDPHRYYLLGQIIVVTNEDGQNEIVDGQQRLTTVYLLLLSLLHAMRSRVDLRPIRHATVFSSLVSSIVAADKDVLRLASPFQDGTKVLRHLYEHGPNRGADLGDMNRPQRNLVAVYEFVLEWIEVNFPTELGVVEFSEQILRRIYFTRLSIDDIPVALDFFEKMNRRGLPLTASDLLKNFMFAQVPEDLFGGLTEVWKEMSDELDECDQASLQSTESFIRAWAISKSCSKINGTEPLLDFWKEELRPPGKIEEFKESLRATAVFYRKTANGILFQDDSGPIMEGVRYFNGVQHLPVLFAGRHLDNFSALCDLIQHRFLVYIFARERTASFESVIPSLCGEIGKLSRDASSEAILGACHRANGFLLPMAHESVVATISSFRYSKPSHLKKIRFVLASVSRHFDRVARTGDYGDPLSKYLRTVRRGVPGIDLDHVYGQKYFAAASAEAREIFNSIGALTMVFSSDHREDTHAKPREKEAMYSRSRYVLTKSLAEIRSDEAERVRTVINQIQSELPVSLDDWTTAFVTKRSSFIAESFCESIELNALMTTVQK